LSQVELRQFVTLAEVARTRSFTAAAESLGYTQSAVSQQISRLERIVGQRLFERSGTKPITLTPAGRILLGHAEHIQARLEKAGQDLNALSDGVAGILRVGCFESISVRLLPRIIKLFAAAYPQVQVLLSEMPDDAGLLSEVEEGDLDLTFVVFPLLDGPFEATILLEDPFMLVVAADSELADSPTPINITDLPELPLIAYGKMRDEHQIESRLGRPNLSRQVIFRSNHNGTILGLAAEGYGAAVLPWLSVDPNRPGIAMLPLARINPRQVGIAWHSRRQQSDAAEAFVAIALQVAQEVEASVSLPPTTAPATQTPLP